MKKYRIGYDYLFLLNEDIEDPDDKELVIRAIAANVLFEIYDQNGREILFQTDELDEQKVTIDGVSFDPNELINCYFDKDNLVKFEADYSKVEDIQCNFEVFCKVQSYSKDLLYPGEIISHSVRITPSEFKLLVDNHISKIDIPNNKPAQSPSYFTQEIKVAASNDYIGILAPYISFYTHKGTQEIITQDEYQKRRSAEIDQRWQRMPESIKEKCYGNEEQFFICCVTDFDGAEQSEWDDFEDYFSSDEDGNLVFHWSR